MDIKITYPTMKDPGLQRRKFLAIVRWPMLLTAVACPIVNYILGGKAWSIVVLMVLYMIWTLALSTDLIEYNRISQFTKLVICTCVLLALIDIFLASGWAIDVVPIVSFCGLIICGVLFFTDLDRQKQNMLPMLSLIFLSLLGSGIGQIIWHETIHWALMVMGAIALILLVVCFIVLGRDFFRELERRFHTE